MKEILIVLTLAFTSSLFCQENKNQGGCQGAFTTKAGNIYAGNQDTISVGGTLMSYFDHDCHINIPNLKIDWYRNDTLCGTSSSFNFDSYYYRDYAYFTATLPGVYTTYIQGYYSPPAFTSVIALSPSNTGIKSINGQNAKCYPNPSTGNFTISYNENMEELIFTDITGNKLFTVKPNALKYNFYLEEQGVYFVFGKSGNSNFSSKIIVVK